MAKLVNDRLGDTDNDVFVVVAGFSVLYLREPLGWNHLIGFILIAGGAAFIFQGR